jgi:DNA-directed RNA polymerase
VGAARRVLIKAIDPMQEALDWFVEETSTRRGPKPVALKWVKEVGSDVCAYMTGKVVLGHRTPVSVKRAALEITGLILDQVRYARLKAAAPEYFEYKMRKFQTSHYSYRKNSLAQAVRWLNEKAAEEGNAPVVELDDLRLTESQRISVGSKLIDLFHAATGLIEIRSVEAKRKKGRVEKGTLLVLTPEALSMIRDGDQQMELLWPVFLPMVVPPNPWSVDERGGYRFGLKDKHPLVRSSGLKSLKGQSDDLPIVFDALNAIQNTAWSINRRVFETVMQVWERGGSLAGLPATVDKPVPSRPEDLATNPEAKRVWKRAAGDIHDWNAYRRAKSASLANTMMVAKLVLEEDAIWFPANLDFRGRVYPIPNYLNPQGDDLSRGLLQFAEGKELGDHGARWLAIHGANCLGEYNSIKFSKLTLSDRHAWIKEHTPAIVDVAEDPMSHLWWSEADEPLQFLAFCFEWADYITKGSSPCFVSHIPVGIDGSCNGIQHFSAMFRDEVGGRAVNLLPLDQPEDLYGRVADTVNDRLVSLVAEGDQLAPMWIRSGLVDRKLAKRPTMTFGYGSNKYGFREQIKDYCTSHDQWLATKSVFELEEDGRIRFLFPQAATMMSVLIWESLQDVVVKSFEGREWMQGATRAVVANGKPMRWTVPVTGFPVRQQYYRYETARVETVLAGKVVRPSVRKRTQQIDKVKQANAIAPNVVHSLDAAALMLTVHMAQSEGLTHFAMIHDSYGTHAGDMELLSRVTRQAFLRLYTEADVATHLYQSFLAQADDPEKVSAPPAKGSLDLGLVLASSYFFA